MCYNISLAKFSNGFCVETELCLLFAFSLIPFFLQSFILSFLYSLTLLLHDLLHFGLV